MAVDLMIFVVSVLFLLHEAFAYAQLKWFNFETCLANFMINFRFKYRLNASLKYLNVSLDYLFILFFVFLRFEYHVTKLLYRNAKVKEGAAFWWSAMDWIIVSFMDLIYDVLIEQWFTTVTFFDEIHLI